jgi:CubicO group peptidase (beta-lactamase class C family)
METDELEVRNMRGVSQWAAVALLLAGTAPVIGAVTEGISRRMTDEQIVKDLRIHLDQLASRDAFSGTVLLAKGDRILFERAYGFASRAFNARNTIATKLNLGSMGKMFTAVAVLQLAQQGKLALDDRLIKLVPDYPDTEVARKITVHQLLTHTSGLGSFFNDKFGESSRAKYRTIASHLPLFVGEPLLFEPGTGWAYSNAGFVVLGLIIERVSGQSYYDYVREHIFAPVGMSNTDNYNVDDDVPNLALGYTYMGFDLRPHLEQPRRTNILMHVGRGSSSGGGYSSVGDLLRFSRALQGHKLLNEEYTQLLLTGKVATHRGTDRYAYGIAETRVNGVRIVGHSGGFPGINGQLDMYPALDYTVVVLSNYDEAAQPVSERLRWLLTGGGIPRVTRLPLDVLRAVAGTYAPVPPPNALSGERNETPPIQMIADAEGLWQNGLFRHHWLPLSTHEFFDEDAPGDRMRFAIDAHGRIVSMTVTRGASGQSLTATRLY